MVIPITIRGANAAERSRLLPVMDTRKRALERLYQRKRAVDNLIRSLESYREAESKRCESICAGAGLGCW
jgi:hypothetical protein